MKILETERLLLREFKTGDAAFIIELLNSPSWLKFIGDRNIHNLDDAEKYLVNGPLKSYYQHGFGLWLVELKNNTPIGMCGLIKRDNLENIDIGFALLPGYEGKGFGFEIASATFVHGKNNLNLSTIVAITSPDNIHSIKLLGKIGLHFEKMIALYDNEPPVMLFSENVKG